MHELSVTSSILEIALRHARQAGAARVTDVYLVIGQMASIVDDSVQFYWDMISENTPAAHATLHFRRIPAELECQACGHHYHLEDTEMVCPHCNHLGFKFVAGDEFYVEAIGVEEQAQTPEETYGAEDPRC